MALAIPISLLSTFVVLQLTGRSLNIISLAGLAFAVGMVLDAAIVVLENIVRTRKSAEAEIENKDPNSQTHMEDCAHRGTKEVFGALMASTATTVAIFIPVMLAAVAGSLITEQIFGPASELAMLSSTEVPNIQLPWVVALGVILGISGVIFKQLMLDVMNTVKDMSLLIFP